MRTNEVGTDENADFAGADTEEEPSVMNTAREKMRPIISRAASASAKALSEVIANATAEAWAAGYEGGWLEAAEPWWIGRCAEIADYLEFMGNFEITPFQVEQVLQHADEVRMKPFVRTGRHRTRVRMRPLNDPPITAADRERDTYPPTGRNAV